MNINTKKYIEEFLKIRDKNSQIIDFKLNLPQQKLYNVIKEQKKLGKPVRIIILKARQMGFSTLTEGILFKETVTKKNINTGIITHVEEATTNLFNMSKLFYNELPEGFKPQILNSNAKELIFNIWDTAGQEKFRSIVSLNYKDAAVIILVFDINNQNSFKCIKDYWYPQVRDKAPKNAILALVGAKCDEIKGDSIDEFEAQNYAKSINAIYKTTSSLQNIGINELFDEIGNKILSSDMHDFIFARNNTNLTFGKTSGEDEDSNYKFSRAASSEKANDNKLRKNKNRCC